MLKKKIIKDTMIYSAANYIAMVIGVLVSFGIKIILGTVGAGYWAILKVVISYGEYSDLGTRNILSRDLPQAVGEGNFKKIALVKDVTFSFSMSMSILSALFVAVFAMLKVHDVTLRYGLVVIALLIILTQGYNYFIVILRAEKKFTELGYLIIQNMLLVAFFPIIGGVCAGLIGLSIGFCIATGLSIILAHRATKSDLNWCIDRIELKRLLKSGMPMVMLSYVLVTFLSMDAIMVGRLISMEDLGLYTIGLMAVQQISRLGRFTSIVIFPHIQERFGDTGSLLDSKDFFIKSTQALICFLPTVIAITAFALEAAVHTFIPQFQGGISSMRILVLGYFFIAINEMSQNILFTINQHSRLVPIYIGLLALGFGLNYLFIKLDYGIDGVAMATSLTYISFFICVFSYAFKKILNWQELISLICKTMVIFVYFVTCFIITTFIGVSDHVWLTAFIRIISIVVLLMPLWIPFERKEHLLATALHVLKAKKGAV